MSAEVRVPTEADRDAIARLISVSINSPIERVRTRVPTWPLEDLRAVYEDGRPIAVAGAFRLAQWFGGRSLPTTGIFGVATEPERRTRGLASDAVVALLRDARERGVPLSTLYPAVLRPYRRLGYEVAGSFNRHRLDLDRIPQLDGPAAAVEVLDLERDVADVRACYEAWARDQTGPVEPDETMWRTRILARPNDDTFRAVVARGEGGVQGFAAFSRLTVEGPIDVAFGLRCDPLIAATGDALRGLLAYFRGHRGLGRWLEWIGPPDEPLGLLVDDLSISIAFRYAWMLRLLDVPAALEGRGIAPAEGSCTIAVRDDLFPENDGPWRLEASGGKLAVSRAERGAGTPIPIGALSALYAGYVRPADLVRFGHLAADDAVVELLSALLAGPTPWCPFFF